MDLKNKKLNIITSCYTNLNCQYCHIDTHLPQTDDLFNKRQIATIYEHFKNRGISAVSFIGGEPLMNAFRLLEMLKLGQPYFQHFSLLTNGLLLEEALLDQLISIGLTELKINLLSFRPDEYNSLAGLVRQMEIPSGLIRYANSKLTTILYVPVFNSKLGNPNESVLEDFDEFMDTTNSKNITFLTTEQDQFNNTDFYKNISAAGKLVRKEQHLEIYNTAKYNIGFLDIISYVSEEGRYYLYPDLKVRTSLSTLDSVYEIPAG